ncbi:hypothetical protein BH20GEM1_BH20GEM1_19890 [soil metagenome]
MDGMMECGGGMFLGLLLVLVLIIALVVAIVVLVRRGAGPRSPGPPA